jgi:hypothetical protein
MNMSDPTCEGNTAGAENPREMSYEEFETKSMKEYEDEGHMLRADIKAVAARVKRYIELSKSTSIRNNIERGEMIANATLSYRHMEDAAMKIGKAMQAIQGGVSILDKIQAENEAAAASAQDTD